MDTRTSPSHSPGFESLQSHNYLRLLFENSSDAIFLRDEHRLFDCNAAAVKMLGYASKEELLGVLVHQLSPEFQPDGRHSTKKAEELVALASAQGSHRFEWEYLRATGERLLVEESLTALHREGDETLFHCVWRDLSDCRVTVATVEALEANYRAIFDASNDSIFVMDVETGAILDANRRACELHGYSIEQFKEMGLGSIIGDDPPYDKAHVLEYIHKAAQGEPQTFEWLGRNNLGERVWVEVSFTLILINGEKRLLSTSHDIVERKRQAALLTERAEQVKRFQAALVELAKSENPDLDTALQHITSVDAETLGAGRVSVWLFSEDCSEIDCLNLCEGAEKRHSQGAVLYAADYPRYFQSLHQKRVICAGDALNDPQTQELAASYLIPAGITSVLDVPIWRHGCMVGIVCHEHIGEPRSWSLEEQDFAISVADMVALAMEASERRQAQEALRQSEASYRSLFDNTQDALYITDDQGVFIDVNPIVEQLYGYKTEELLGRTAIMLADPVRIDMRALNGHIQKALDGVPQHFEWWARRKDGSTFLKEMTLVRAPYFGRDVLLATGRDITERKRAEEALQKAHDNLRQAHHALQRSNEELEKRVAERTVELATTNKALQAENAERLRAEDELRSKTAELEAIVQASPDLYFQLDPEGRVLAYHAAQTSKRYIAPEVFMGKKLQEVMPTQAGEQLTSGLAQVLETGSVASIEYDVRIGEEMRSFEARLLPLLGERVIVIVRDITERREAEEALLQAKNDAENARDEAQRANRAKSEFLSRMSHELRTPMNSILGFAQVLQRKAGPEHQKNVEHILKAGRHLLELINEVLDVSRIESNRIQISLEPVRLSLIVGETLSLIQPMAAQRACTIEDHISEHSDFYVEADRQRLTQVLLNLVSNAIKYNTENGTVTLTCEQVGDKLLRVNVSDTGIGLTPEQMQRLFNPFDRLGAEQSPIEGTGLGLALSKGLVEVMEGQMGAESVVGEGSTFWFELMMAESPEERLHRSHESLAALAQNAAGSKSSTLLYIEDNLANLNLVETILAERAEVALLSALQGQLGLELAAEHQPHVILLDLHLPDIKGDQVLARLRRDPRTRDIPVIIISAEATPGHIETIKNAGAQAYLTKPLNIDQFLETLDDLLEKTGTDAPAKTGK